MQRDRFLKRICPPLVTSGLLILASTAPAIAQERSEKSLYERLGRYDAIAAVVDDFLGRLINDPQFSRFFTGHSTDSKKRLRQLIVDQLCAVTGGPCFYIGRDMKTSHAGLGITEKEWEAAAKHLVASLERFKVPEIEKEQVLVALSRLKPDIVEAP